MQSLRCLGRGGRHLVVGFASGIEAEEIPMVSGRALCFGNFDLVGDSWPMWTPPSSRTSTGCPVPVPRFNPPTADVGTTNPGPCTGVLTEVPSDRSSVGPSPSTGPRRP